MTLKQELTKIRGIGDAKAEEILVIVEEYDTGVSESDLEDIQRLLERNRTDVALSRIEELVG